MIMTSDHVYNAVRVTFTMIVPMYMYKVRSVCNHTIKISLVLSYRNAVVHIQFGLLEPSYFWSA